MTKPYTSGDFLITMIWDTSLATGVDSEGTIRLSFKNELQYESNLIISAC